MLYLLLWIFPFIIKRNQIVPLPLFYIIFVSFRKSIFLIFSHKYNIFIRFYKIHKWMIDCEYVWLRLKRWCEKKSESLNYIKKKKKFCEISKKSAKCYEFWSNPKKKLKLCAERRFSGEEANLNSFKISNKQNIWILLYQIDERMVSVNFWLTPQTSENNLDTLKYRNKHSFYKIY